MRRRSLIRDVIGTGFVFLFLVAFTFLVILGENLLEAFKSH